MSNATQARAHRWTFHRIGGLDQVSLATGADLAHLPDLDQKLWVALGCPTRGLELDARTLRALDADGDGRVRAPEVLAAVKWCEARLVDLGALVAGKAELPLSALRSDTPEGRAVAAAARRILAARGRAQAEALVAEDVEDTSHVFEGTLFNGDGIVPSESAEDPEVRAAIADAIACAGAEADRSGRPGLSKKRLEAFFADLAAYEGWWKAAEAGAGILPAGAATPAAHAAVAAVRARVDDHFARCALAAVDPRAAAWLGRNEADWTALAAKDLGAAPDAAAFPIARVEPGRPLPLVDGLNPSWAGAVAALARDAVAPLLGPGRTALTAADWAALKERLAPWEAHLAARAGGAVEKLGIARVRALLAGGARAATEALLAKDLAVDAESNAVDDAARLFLYHRDLHALLRNFVSFADLYDPVRPAIFQAGTLLVDARSCELCIRVEDPAAHAALEAQSRLFLAYCDLRRPGETMKVAACVTQGDADFLAVGRNGIFYDRKGRDWDATIVRIVDNPISLRQAFWSPYKKFMRMIEDQVAKFAAAREKESDARLATAATGVTGAATGAPPPKAEPVDVGKMVGIIAALGVGVGALGTLLGGFVSGFVGLQPWWAKLVAVAGAAMAISGPSMIIAWLKLRQRNLGPVLDANGWAVNGRVKVNVPLGMALTGRAVLPRGAHRSLADPYADEAAVRRRRLLWLLVAVAAIALAVARRQGWWPFAR
jgi:hypothetical protein